MAMNTNIVTIVGNLTKDVEARKVNNENAVFTSTVAVNGYKEDEVMFLPIEVWNRQGRAFSDYCGKGSKVAVTGSLKQDRFTTKDGQDVTLTKVNVSQVEFLDPKTDEPQPDQAEDDSKGRAFEQKEDLAF